LNDLTMMLGISKGSASMGVRQLEQWGAVVKIWVRGDRKDYYRANDAFGRIIKNAIKDLAGKRMERSTALLNQVESELAPAPARRAVPDDEAFIRDQIGKMRAFQKKAQGLWDGILLKMLLR
jgi:DNA-binding transcriptional regulator GbsR (MarR family)